MEITITPQDKKTAEKYFNNQNQWLTIKPAHNSTLPKVAVSRFVGQFCR